jgi:ABC-type multidrug transport system fused ATPase/permease subunit
MREDDVAETASGQIGAITQSFDTYEYTAVIIPGATLLVGLLIAFQDAFPSAFNKDLTLGAFGMFLVAAYVVGQVLRAIGDLAEKRLWDMRGGQPTEWVLNDNDVHKLLDASQRAQLTQAVRELLASPTLNLSDYAEKKEEWQAVTRRIYAKVSGLGRSARIDAFNRTFGMMNGITIAFLVLAVIFLIEAALSGKPWFLLFAVLAVAFAAVTLNRFFQFGKYYGRELFVQFLDSVQS